MIKKLKNYLATLTRRQRRLQKSGLVQSLMVPPVLTLVTGFLVDGHARVGTGREMRKLLRIDLLGKSLFLMMVILYAICQSLGMRILAGI